jgi:phosphatidylethanolamine/phosphatidyl-N-methylethanolamine N-methyltransferase
VLEIGVGTGLTLRRYRKDHKVVGIDISPEMLARAQLRIRRSNGHGQVMRLAIMDAAHLAFPDESFESVIAAYVVSVVPDPARVIAEIERVCRPGGDVVLVNHFRAENGVRAAVEKGLAPFSDKLGWRPDFELDEVLSRTTLKLVDTIPISPFGLFTLLRLRKAG